MRRVRCFQCGYLVPKDATAILPVRVKGLIRKSGSGYFTRYARRCTDNCDQWADRAEAEGQVQVFRGSHA